MMLIILKKWFPLAVVTTLLSGMILVSMQQFNRLSANDLPVQLAEDIADRLEHGMQPQALVGSVGIEMDKSIAPFVIVLDSANKVIVSSAVLNGQQVVPPAGAIDWARQHGEYHVTWQPASGVRSAIVIIPAQDPEHHMVIAGHSLRNFESRIDQIQIQIAVMWLVTILLTYGLLWVIEPKRKN